MSNPGRALAGNAIRTNARRLGRRALCHFIGFGSIDPDAGQAALGVLKVAGSLLAALGHDVVADLLAFHERAHAGALDGADMHEHVLAAVRRLNESKAFLAVEELDGTCGHHGLLALYALRESDHANIALRVIRVLGAS